MDTTNTMLFFIVGFVIIALASKQIGDFFARFKLPKITGYLFTGIIVGGFFLSWVSEDAVSRLRFIDEISLAFIAFAAGNELFLPEIKGRLKSIGWVLFSLVLVTFTLVSIVMFSLAQYIPFMSGMSTVSITAVSILAGAILVARSPSSAIAIVNELRAKGPFTQIILSVTVIMDVLVIIIFALSASAADALLNQAGLNLGFIVLIFLEFTLALVTAFVLFKILGLILSLRTSQLMKTILILLSGFGVFLYSDLVRDASHTNLPFEILVEPLLICMVAGFLVNNYSHHRLEFSKILQGAGPYVFTFFFTLTGASLKIDVLLSVWSIALALFAIRLVSIMVSTFAGGLLAGEPMKYNKLMWMGFVTQAGVALGLAKEVSVEFPEFGGPFATMIIAIVVLNEMVGPIFFKFAVNRVGEAHPRGEAAPFDGERDAIIFGLRGQAVMLARQLLRHDWQVKIVCRTAERMQELATPDVNIVLVEDLTLATMKQLNADKADAIVSFLPDDESFQICELAYEHFGTERIVVHLRDRANFSRFHELGVLVVEPQTAVVSLLEHFVRSPSGTSLLLGMDAGQDVIDLEVRSPLLHGVALRDLRLPIDVLVLTIHRDSHTLVARGHTQLHLGDKVTMVGPQKELEEVSLRFSS